LVSVETSTFSVRGLQFFTMVIFSVLGLMYHLSFCTINLCVPGIVHDILCFLKWCGALFIYGRETSGSKLCVEKCICLFDTLKLLSLQRCMDTGKSPLVRPNIGDGGQIQPGFSASFFHIWLCNRYPRSFCNGVFFRSITVIIRICPGTTGFFKEASGIQATTTRGFFVNPLLSSAGRQDPHTPRDGTIPAHQKDTDALTTSKFSFLP